LSSVTCGFKWSEVRPVECRHIPINSKRGASIGGCESLPCQNPSWTRRSTVAQLFIHAGTSPMTSMSSLYYSRILATQFRAVPCLPNQSDSTKRWVECVFLLKVPSQVCRLAWAIPTSHTSKLTRPLPLLTSHFLQQLD
jgi:hypothetical protein